MLLTNIVRFTVLSVAADECVYFVRTPLESESPDRARRGRGGGRQNWRSRATKGCPVVRARDGVFWSRAPNAGDGQRRGRYVEIGSRPKSIADLWTLTAQTTTDGCTCTRMRLRFGSVRFEESSGLAHDSHDTKQRFD